MTARKAAPAPAAGPFRDLTEFLGEGDRGKVADAAPIELPIGGKPYRFPGAVSGRTGLLLTTVVDAMMTARAGAEPGAPEPGLVELLTDEQEDHVRAEIFDGMDVELARDGHDSRVIRHVFLTLVMWHAVGPEAAVTAWESVGNPPAPNRKERRAGTSRAGSAAAGRTTRTRTSGSGTRATSRATASRGATSSRAGRS